MSVGPPRDAGEWAALAAAILVLVATREKRLSSWGSARVFRATAALVAAAISGIYIVAYLRGGPRIIDATTYFLEGRALAEGHLAWPVGDLGPEVAGRFLVRDTLGSGEHIAGIFPPGYPALLSLGFLAHAPLATGPFLAAAITWLTFDLTAEVARRLALASDDRAICPRVAALLSIACAALRYHTADTMSHGLAAALLTGGLLLALRLRRDATDASAPRDGARVALAFALGWMLGWLFATRPVSGAVGAILIAWVLARSGIAVRTVFVAVAGAATPLALFVLSQRAATGAFFASSQSLYYAVSDGPAGCFAYGLGPRVGCRLEHGEFVEHNLRSGYDLLAAAATTARRLKMHLVDATNAEPLALFTALAIGLGARRSTTRPLALALPLFALAYAPFYFDGNYPGGGARFFADQLPLEHVLLAVAVPSLTTALGRARDHARTARLGGMLVSLSLAGFAFFAGKQHAQLRDREGGRPMFEPSVLDAHGVTRGLVLVDTDHGLALGYDPDARAERGVEVARFRGDASDRWLYEARGRPPTFRYEYAFDPGARERVTLVPFEPPATDVLEAESLWPPIRQLGAWARPSFHACASGGRWLALVPDGEGPGVTLALPARLGGALVRIRIFIASGSTMHLSIDADGARLSSFDERDVVPLRGPCAGELFDLPPVRIPDTAKRISLTAKGASSSLTAKGASSSLTAKGASSSLTEGAPRADGATTDVALDALGVVETR